MQRSILGQLLPETTWRTMVSAEGRFEEGGVWKFEVGGMDGGWR